MGMVVQQVIQLCRSLKVANLGLFSVTHSLSYKNYDNNCLILDLDID